MEKNSIEKLVAELRTVIPFKDSTKKGDIVLVIAQEPQMLIFGLVTSIERDASKKDEWWNIGLSFLTVPLQKVVWTLRTAQMTGQEIFSMGGEKRFFQAVEMVSETTGPFEEMAKKSDRVARKGTIKRIK